MASKNIPPTGYPVLGFPYLVLMKMNSGRGRDFGDVTTMLGWADEEQLAAVRDMVTRYSPADKNGSRLAIPSADELQPRPRSHTKLHEVFFQPLPDV